MQFRDAAAAAAAAVEVAVFLDAVHFKWGNRACCNHQIKINTHDYVATMTAARQHRCARCSMTLQKM